MPAAVRQIAKSTTAIYPFARKCLNDKRPECIKLCRKLAFNLFFYMAAEIDKYAENFLFRHSYGAHPILAEEQQCILKSMLHVIIVRGSLPPNDFEFVNLYYSLLTAED